MVQRWSLFGSVFPLSSILALENFDAIDILGKYWGTKVMDLEMPNAAGAFYECKTNEGQKTYLGRALTPSKVHSARLPPAFAQFYGKISELDRELKLSRDRIADPRAGCASQCMPLLHGCEQSIHDNDIDEPSKVRRAG